MPRLVLTVLFAHGALQLFAEASESWNCQNEAVEIGCDASGCKVSDAHTPMSVSLRPDQMSVCAYTGCWEGRPDAVITTGQFQTWTGSSLVWSSAPQAESGATVSITVNTKDGVANLMVDGVFAHPARCRPS